MLSAEMILKKHLKSVDREYLFEYTVDGTVAGGTGELIAVDLLKPNDPVRKTTLPVRPFMEGKFINFEVLTENLIEMEVTMYSAEDMTYKNILLEYTDIAADERLSDDTLNKYYRNRDNPQDHKIYIYLNNLSGLDSGEITIRFIVQDLTQWGR